MSRTPQEVIKTFMNSLDNSSLSASAALNEAIRSCSNFTSMNDAINHFISDAQKVKGKKFLRDYCDIDLDNDDTGAITGSEAGGSVIKTAESVVPESGSLAYPSGTSFTKRGLTVIIPEKSTLSKAQKNIVRGLNSWWIAEALKLNEESYGLSFKENGVSVKEITLKFENDNESGALAYVGSTSGDNGLAEELELVVNMAYYGSIASDDVNGQSSGEDVGYLDRTIAHEFTHAVMAANISCYENLPLFILEGLAELTHGIDDERKDEILELAKNPSNMNKYLKVNRVDVESETEDYSSGYMFLRYLAKQGSISSGEEDDDSGLTYNDDETILTADTSFEGNEIDLADYADTVKIVDASALKNSVKIVGNKFANTISGGSKADTIYGGVGADLIRGNIGADKLFGDNGKDTIYGGNGKDYIEGGNGADLIDGGNGVDTLVGGKGKDTLTGGNGKNLFVYANGDGHDVITDYVSGQDTIKISSGEVSEYATDDDDVIFYVGNGSITVKNAVGKDINFIDSEGDSVTYNTDDIDNEEESAVYNFVENNFERWFIDDIEFAGTQNSELNSIINNNTAINFDNDYAVDSIKSNATYLVSNFATNLKKNELIAQSN